MRSFGSGSAGRAAGQLGMPGAVCRGGRQLDDHRAAGSGHGSRLEVDLPRVALEEPAADVQPEPLPRGGRPPNAEVERAARELAGHPRSEVADAYYDLLPELHRLNTQRAAGCMTRAVGQDVGEYL